jgi:hypothetical protein
MTRDQPSAGVLSFPERGGRDRKWGLLALFCGSFLVLKYWIYKHLLWK